MPNAGPSDVQLIAQADSAKIAPTEHAGVQLIAPTGEAAGASGSEFSTSLRKSRSKQIVPNDWLVIPGPKSDDDAKALVEECVRRNGIMLSRLTSAARSVGGRRLKKLGRQYMRSESARIAQLFLALRSRNRKISKPGSQWTYSRIAAEGRKLTVYDGRGDPVWIHGVDDGRTVLRFADWDKARQSLADNVAKRILRFPEGMFLFNGGEAAAMKWLKVRLPNAHAIWITDFPKCFYTLDRELVENGLPLPRRATRSLLFDPMKRAKVAGSRGRKDWVAPDMISHSDLTSVLTVGGSSGCVGEFVPGRGVPPGAVPASLAAQVALKPVFAAVLGAAPGVQVGLFADNLIILLPNKAAEAPVEFALTASAAMFFDECVVNELLRRTSRFKPDEAFEYLGRQIQLQEGVMEMRALEEHCSRLFFRVQDDLDRVRKSADLERIKRRLSGWCARHAGDIHAMQVALDLSVDVGRDEFRLECVEALKAEKAAAAAAAKNAAQSPAGPTAKGLDT